MSELGKFIAFQAAIALLQESHHHDIILRTFNLCEEEVKKHATLQRNVVKDIYSPFTDVQISAKVAELVKPKNGGWTGSVDVIYQTIPDLHAALGRAAGDWYFSGDYPTPGGIATANEAYIRYHRGLKGRPYELFTSVQ
jgi:amidophosphoribosyltransferase